MHNRILFFSFFAAALWAASFSEAVAQRHELSPRELLGEAESDYYNAKDYARVYGTCSALIEKTGTAYPQAHFLRGCANFFLREYDEMQADFAVAAQLAPQLFQNMLNSRYAAADELALQAYLSAMLGRGEAARLLFTQALTASPLNDRVYAARGLSRLLVRDTKAGCADCQKALDLSDSSLLRSTAIKTACFPDTTLTSGWILPEPMQFFARGTRDAAADSAFVTLAGMLRFKGCDSVVLEILKNNTPWKRLSQRLVYKKNVSAFSFKPSIHAEFSEYSFRLVARSKRKRIIVDSVLAMRDRIVCGDVVMIGGQSNGFIGTAPAYDKSSLCRTLVFGERGFGWYTPTQANTNTQLNLDARLANKVGGIAGRIQTMIAETANVPVCVVQGSLGATSIQEQLPEQRPFFEMRHNPHTQLQQRIRRTGAAEGIKAFVWVQGESNTDAGYLTAFQRLSTHWKQMLPSLRNVYIVQLRPSLCRANESKQGLWELQRSIGAAAQTQAAATSAPSTSATQSSLRIETVSSGGLTFSDGCHYSDSSALKLGEQIGRLIQRDLYGSTDTTNISAPMITKAYFSNATFSNTTFSNATKTEITLEFRAVTELCSTPDVRTDSTVQRICDAFSVMVLDSNRQYKDRFRAFTDYRLAGNTLTLRLREPMNVVAISYLPNQFYALANGLPSKTLFEGPWLVNPRGYGALAFYRFPVQAR